MNEWMLCIIWKWMKDKGCELAEMNELINECCVLAQNHWNNEGINECYVRAKNK